MPLLSESESESESASTSPVVVPPGVSSERGPVRPPDGGDADDELDEDELDELDEDELDEDRTCCCD